MSVHHSAVLKAKKILGCYDQLQPRQYVVQPHLKSNEKQKRQHSLSSSSKQTSTLKKDFSFCKSNKKSDASLVQSSAVKHKKSNASFTSLYGRETRYDKIMKLKVKPAFKQEKKVDRTKKSVLENSFSSCGSEREESKENRVRNKSRLDRIMNIKITKPNVASTLTNYQPRQGVRSISKEKKQSVVKQWKQSQNKLKRSKQQQQKEDRLWKVFERQREIRLKLRKNAEQRQYKQQRRRQQRFQNMVNKQVGKIQREREISKRKSQGFSNYVYPFF